jgi:hypothetical protein
MIVQLWQKHKAAVGECEVSQKEFTGPKKLQFLEMLMAVLAFFQEKSKIDIICIVLFLQHVQCLCHFSEIF